MKKKNVHLNREQFDYLKTSFEHIRKQLEKLSILEEIQQSVKDIKSCYEELKFVEEKKKNEHVKSKENAVEYDGEKSVEKINESRSDVHDQILIDQNVNKAIRKFRRTAKSRKRSPSGKAFLKLSTKFACEAFSSRLKIDPTKVLRRKKKYKCDDGG